MEHKIISWNVNGIRACAKKGFAQWLENSGASIVGLQETRAIDKQFPAGLLQPEGWHSHLSAAERLGYSGVMLYSRRPFGAVETQLGLPEHDIEGRVQVATFGSLTIVNAYFPNGSGKDRDNGRVPFKLEFYEKLREWMNAKAARGEKVLVMGDWNTAHREIDLARPKDNVGTSGFLPVEREYFERWIQDGWIDTFRAFNSEGGNYTWWSNRAGARERNIGWRIDYILASPAAMTFIRDAEIHPHVLGSDHCPISVTVDAAIFE